MVAVGVLFHRGQWNGSSDRSLGVARLHSRCVWTRPNRFLSFFLDISRFLLSSGVCNTDNFSLLSITIDYGPFGFMDSYDPGACSLRRPVPSHPGGGGGHADAAMLQVSSPTPPMTRAGTAPALRPTPVASTWGSCWRRSGPSSQRDSGESETPAGGFWEVSGSKRDVLPHQGPEGFKRLRGDLPEEVKRPRLCRR